MKEDISESDSNLGLNTLIYLLNVCSNLALTQSTASGWGLIYRYDDDPYFPSERLESRRNLC